MAQPFSARTGIPVRFVDTDDPAGMVLGGLPVDGAVLASAREHGLHLREHGLHGGGIGRHAHLLQVLLGHPGLPQELLEHLLEGVLALTLAVVVAVR